MPAASSGATPVNSGLKSPSLCQCTRAYMPLTTSSATTATVMRCATERLKKIFSNLSVAQRITVAVVALLVVSGIYALVHWHKEGDFKPLFTGVAPEDAAGIVQKLKESGVEYRLPE